MRPARTGRSVAAILAGVVLLVTACGGGPEPTGSTETDQYPFATRTTADSIIYVVRNTPDAVGGINVERNLVEAVAAIPGVVAATGSAATRNLVLFDADGYPIDLPNGPAYGATFVPGEVQPFQSRVVVGDAPLAGEFAIDEGTAGVLGLEVGDEIGLESDGGTVVARLAGLIVSPASAAGTTPVMVDSETARTIFSPEGRFRSLVAEVELAEATSAASAIEALLPQQLELSVQASLPGDVGDADLESEICSYLDGGGNDLLDVIDMARDPETDDRFERAYAAAASIQLQCPAWTVTDDTRALLADLYRAIVLSDITTDAETTDLFAFWEDSCELAASGALVENHVTGLEVDWDNPYESDQALLQFVVLCPEFELTLPEPVN